MFLGPQMFWALHEVILVPSPFPPPPPLPRHPKRLKSENGSESDPGPKHIMMPANINSIVVLFSTLSRKLLDKGINDGV